MQHTIITRKFLEGYGNKLPPELAYVVSDEKGRRIITWAEVMEKRKAFQGERLRRKREFFHFPWRAYKLWVGYFDQSLMGGWHAFLEDYRGRPHSIWIERHVPLLKPDLMKTFPLILQLESDREQWEAWKVEFAKQFERRRQCRRPLGVAYIWWNKRDMPRRAHLKQLN